MTETPQEEAERKEYLRRAVALLYGTNSGDALVVLVANKLQRISTLERKLKGAEEALEQISNHVIGDTNGNAKPSVASQIALKTLTAIREEEK